MVYLGKTDYELAPDPDDAPDPKAFRFLTKIKPVVTHHCQLPPTNNYKDYIEGSEGYCTDCGQMWVLTSYDDSLVDQWGLYWVKKTKKVPGKHWWNKATHEPVKIQLGKKKQDLSFLY